MKYIQPNWPAPKNIKAYTTIRTCWGEKDPDISTESLNNLLHLPTDPIWLTQKHGITAVEAKKENKKTEADASFTSHTNQICAVLTADCLPLLICDKQGTHVAAIHAGWRGLANGIIESTLNFLPLPPEDLLVWLGPAIGPDKFEVGKDVYDAFVEKDPRSNAAFTSLNNGKWLANLYALATLRLRSKGIFQIYGGDYCTHTQEDLFFSYRRDGKTGRMASLIWITS